MTDNRTTELRGKLDALGIEYETNDYMNVRETSWNGFTAMQLTFDAKLMMAFTPEQAIAATLGRGTLTAEQVRKCVRIGACDHGLWDALDEDTDWQAISDELNAELGSGTCENVAPDYIDFLCSECGFVHYHSDENDSGDGNDWAFCPRCGKDVKR